MYTTIKNAPQAESFLVIVRHSRGWYSLHRAVNINGRILSVAWECDGLGKLSNIKMLIPPSSPVLTGIWAEKIGKSGRELVRAS